MGRSSVRAPDGASGALAEDYGHVPWELLEEVLHLVEDFGLDSTIELNLVEAGAPPGGVRVRYMRATPDRDESPVWLYVSSSGFASCVTKRRPQSIR